MSGRTGWAWGTTDSGDWLTILGSAWNYPALATTADEAVKPAVNLVGAELVLAKVREVRHPGVTGNGMAYEILERGGDEQK